TIVLLSNPITADDDGGETTQVLACVVNYHTAGQPLLGVPWGYTAAVDHVYAGDDESYAAGDWVSFADNENFNTVQESLQETLDDANNGITDPDLLVNPFGGLNADGDCGDVLEAGTLTFNDGVAIGGVALQQATAGTPDDDDDDNGDDNG